MTFAFFHWGPDTLIPTILVRSIRKHNPEAVIVQCSDEDSPHVEGCDETIRVDGPFAVKGGRGDLMRMRLEAFAQVGSGMFLDTDMICRKAINFEELLGDNDVMVCRRELYADRFIRPQHIHIDVSEYFNRTYGEVYPYLACMTIVRSPEFWQSCLDNLMTLDPKFQSWFGDQEAIRNVVKQYKFGELPEREYAFALDMTGGGDPAFIHFKGRHKKMMIGTAIMEKLIAADLARVS